MGETLPIYRVAAGHAPAVRRAGDRRARRGRRVGDRALPDPALQVVDPLGVPGQPVDAVAVPRRPDGVDERAGRRRDRGARQRLGRGGQPQRRAGGARDRHPPDARGHRVRLPRPGAGGERAEVRGDRPPRRHPQLADPDPGQADASDRRLRPAVVRVQLPRPDRQPARRGHGRPPPRSRRRWSTDDARHGPDGHGHEPRQVHRLPHLLGHLQAGVDQPQRRRVRVVQQRRDPPRAGLPAALPGPGAVEGRLGAQPARPAHV